MWPPHGNHLLSKYVLYVSVSELRSLHAQHGHVHFFCFFFELGLFFMAARFESAWQLYAFNVWWCDWLAGWPLSCCSSTSRTLWSTCLLVLVVTQWRQLTQVVDSSNSLQLEYEMFKWSQACTSCLKMAKKKKGIRLGGFVKIICRYSGSSEFRNFVGNVNDMINSLL